VVEWHGEGLRTEAAFDYDCSRVLEDHMMKPISIVRREISRIDGALYDVEPERHDPGLQEGVASLWLAAEEIMTGTPSNEKFGGDEDDTDADEAPAIEEMLEYGPIMDEAQIVRALEGPEGKQLEQSVLVKGVDGLAWYVNFHVKGAQWGVYIPTSGLAYMMVRVFGRLPVNSDTKMKIAFRALHQHELFHFAVDYMSAQWEAITGHACHRPARALKDSVAGYILREEELANAHMIRSLRGGSAALKVRGRSEALRLFTRRQPAGYQDAERSTRRVAFDAGCEALARDYVSKISGIELGFIGGVDLLRIYPLSPAIDWRYCPIHIIHDERRLNIPPVDLGLFSNIATIVENEHFKTQFPALPSAIQEAWIRKKQMLAVTTAAKGLDFKFWERRGTEKVYSIRLSANYRAHLAYSGVQWAAIGVGTHAAMGHG